MEKRYRELYDGNGNLLSQEEIPYTLNDILETRKAEYPDIGDQLDIIWKQFKAQKDSGISLADETNTMIDKIFSVKEKYKKP
jgi:hypothetical protein